MISSLNLLSRIDVSPRAEIYNIVHVMLWSNHSKKAEEEDSRTARARAGDGGRALTLLCLHVDPHKFGRENPSSIAFNHRIVPNDSSYI